MDPSIPLAEAQLKRNVHWKPQIQITPWVHFTEFTAVGRSLLAAADTTKMRSEQIKHALERVSIWQARSQRLPHAVEASAALAHVLWREHCSPSSSSTSVELRLSYSAAIIRSINGLADALDQERAVATSVAQRSNQLGIPSWLVEVRHRATHNEKPSLSVLRMAATTLLHYFEAVYWRPLEQKRLEYESTASTLLEEYRSAVKNSSQIELNSSSDSLGEKVAALSTDKGGGIGKEDLDLISDNDGDNELGEDDSATFYGSKIGTCFNSFAVLQEPKKKKKKVEKKNEKVETLAADLLAKPEPNSKRKKKKKTTDVPSPNECAKRYVKSNIPADIASHSAIHFLIELAILAPDDLEMFPQTFAGFKKLRHYHLSFIVALVKEWPGFLATLTTHLIDSVLALERSMKCLSHVREICSTSRKLYFLSAWFEYLLSWSFLAAIATSQKKDGPQLTRLEAIRALNVPIETLRNRCKPMDGHELGEGSRVRHLREVMESVLESNRAQGVLAGAENRQDDSIDITEGIFGDADPSEDPSLIAFANNKLGSTLSPKELRQHPHSLFVDSAAVASSISEPESVTFGNVRVMPQPWVLCESWEPCSIGIFNAPEPDKAA